MCGNLLLDAFEVRQMLADMVTLCIDGPRVGGRLWFWEFDFGLARKATRQLIIPSGLSSPRSQLVNASGFP
jgi:hypothetical protein